VPLTNTRAVLKAITPPILWQMARRLQGLTRPSSVTDVSLSFGTTTITLPAGHALPEYLRQFQNYDQFLPVLARELPSKSWVIDIGANCGDTLAAMVATNPSLNFICVEADDTYFKYLEKNVDLIRAAHSDIGDIRPVRALVGTTGVSGKLAGERGTKHLVASKNGQSATPLTSIVHDYLPENAQISIIKVDVDGFDYDVLRSAGPLLDAPEMMIYFECAFFNDEQKDGFVRLFEELKRQSFVFLLFDNFGSPMINTKSLDIITSLLNYSWLQTKRHATRTIYYYDVLAYRLNRADIVGRILTEWPVTR